MRIPFLLVLMCFMVSVALAHNSYTGGYSGSPGSRTCASSCHGRSGGTLTISGFPTTYVPGQTYRVTVKHVSGAAIVKYNVTTRVGSTTVVAGTFAPMLNSALYTGTDGGVSASPHAIDSAVFQWTAPKSGTGAVTLYAAAFQGSTSSSSGQSSTTSIVSTETVTSIRERSVTPTDVRLAQNYPNPFNPTTLIQFSLPSATTVDLEVFDMLGRSVATLDRGFKPAGTFSVSFDGSGLAGGIYLYRLTTAKTTLVRIMTLIK